MTDNHNKLSEVLDRDGASLFALFARITLCEERAEELLQTLFLKLRWANNIDRLANSSGYVFSAAIDLAFDWRKNRPDTPKSDEASPPQDGEQSPSAELIRSQELEDMLDGIAKLKGQRREIFVLRHIQGKSNDEIAEQLAMTSHHVRSLSQKAMVKLQKILKAGENMGLEY